MTGRIAEEKIQEIRERSDIVEVVSSYLPLRRSGANHQGLSPFHSEKSPSFNVNSVRQIFHCFGCGVGGNVFSFLMRMEGLSFPEAVRRLGERVGVEVEAEAPTPEDERRREESERLVRINEVACDFYHQTLLEAAEGAAGRRYLKERGYGGEIAREFRLGFAPERWEALAGHLAGKGFDPRWARDILGLTRAGKEGRGDYDLFRRRLIFPIYDLRGQVVAFGGRVLDDSLPKYINSPESPLYHKGRILFGLFQARERMRQGGEGIVVEGYFDQLALHRAGFANAVATCGTALTEEHARLLKRYAQRVLLLFDQDSAGRKATFRAMDVLLAEGLPAAVVELDAGEDPDSFLRKRGVEAFRQRLAAARPVLEVFMEATLSAHGEGIEGRARAVAEIAAKLALLPSDIERSLYVKALAQRTGLAEELLGSKARPRVRPAAQAAVSPPVPAAVREATGSAPGENRRPRDAGAASRAQDLLLQMLVAEARIRQQASEVGAAALFLDEDRRIVAEKILSFAGRDGLERVLSDSSLSENQKAILSGILIRDEQLVAEDPERIFQDCRQAATREQQKIRSRELQQLIRQAEAAGEWERHSGLLRELTELKKRS
jgi:DNA primase